MASATCILTDCENPGQGYPVTTPSKPSPKTHPRNNVAGSAETGLPPASPTCSHAVISKVVPC